jgi:hypothetical protein
VLSKRRLICLSLTALLILPVAALAAPHTPAPGSPERKAICDSLRTWFIRTFHRHDPSKPILFKIDILRVDGDFAWFEGIPVNADGSFVNDLPDIGYTMILKKKANAWVVVCDLSRSDVPSEEEVVQIRKTIPTDMPSSIIPDFWRKLLHR